MLCGAAGDQGLENMGVADLLGAAHGLLEFEAIDHGLHGGIRGPLRFRERFLQFTDGGRAPAPEGLHNPELQPRQLWRWHRKMKLLQYAVVGKFFLGTTVDIVTITPYDITRD